MRSTACGNEFANAALSSGPQPVRSHTAESVEPREHFRFALVVQDAIRQKDLLVNSSNLVPLHATRKATFGPSSTSRCSRYDLPRYHRNSGLRAAEDSLPGGSCSFLLSQRLSILRLEGAVFRRVLTQKLVSEARPFASGPGVHTR